MKTDMSLSEFMNLATAELKNEVTNEWTIKVPLASGETLTLNLNAPTEFEAKEQAFEYLKQEIESANAIREIDERQYSYAELLSFGRYLLSKRRRDSIKNHPGFNQETFLWRYQMVHQADVLNWKEENNNP